VLGDRLAAPQQAVVRRRDGEVEQRVAIDLRDGTIVDTAKVFHGNKDLKTTLPDGTEIAVRIDSGMVGELVRAQVRRADGSWVDLEQRAVA